MPVPKLIPGGESILGTSFEGPQLPGPMGVFAEHPGSTPKYALNAGPRDAEYRETMARLFIQMPAQERKLFVKSVPKETRPLAQVLCGVGEGASGGTGFVDFLLTGVSEPLQEKIQVVETLSDNFVVYTFGQKAPVFTYSGVLLNSYQDDQRVWMHRIYRDIARGTQLARRKKLIRMRYDSVIVSGIWIAFSTDIKGEAVNYAQFSIQMIPMQYVIITEPITDPTRLKTPFTEGAQYGLLSSQAPATNRLRVSPATHGAAPTPKSKPAATVDNEVLAQLDRENAKNARQSLQDRTKPQMSSSAPTDEESNIYTGVLPGEEQSVLTP